LEFFVKAAGLTTNNLTFGHRFLEPKTISVSTFENYEKDLEAAKIIVDSVKRKNMIIEQLQTICNAKNLKFLPDENLLQEVTGLVEYPFVGLGNIEQKFMALPNAVLSTSMRVHQKYFSILNADETYAPHFAFVANVPINNEHMLPGYEKVLRARLSDALFFYEQDLKVDFKEGAASLNNVVFHAKLGSVLDKIKRLEICAQDALTKEAAKLCKSDLLTLMVGEFPELQGVMGEIYASAQGVEKSVAKAISSYYKPNGADDDCPADEIGWQLSLIDKIDSLVGFLGIGIKPSGSKDPYGLRRSSLGIIRLMLSKNNPCDLNIWLERSVASYKAQGVVLSENTIEIVINFITERLSGYLKNDMPADHIYAVLDQPLNDVWVTVEKAKALKNLLQMESGKALQTAYVRVVGVLKQQPEGDVNQSLFTEMAEKNLYAMLAEINPKINKALAQFNFIEAMEELANIKPAIDNFFDNVKVMDENLNVQKNRLHLLQLLQKTMYSFANFSKLEG
jgi:glycyl-tRNA synthetase beta chain